MSGTPAFGTSAFGATPNSPVGWACLRSSAGLRPQGGGIAFGARPNSPVGLLPARRWASFPWAWERVWRVRHANA
eukprot:2440362-Alexandrium_andersonii.AAC.1